MPHARSRPRRAIGPGAVRLPLQHRAPVTHAARGAGPPPPSRHQLPRRAASRVRRAERHLVGAPEQRARARRTSSTSASGIRSSRGSQREVWDCSPRTSRSTREWTLGTSSTPSRIDFWRSSAPFESTGRTTWTSPRGSPPSLRRCAAGTRRSPPSSSAAWGRYQLLRRRPRTRTGSWSSRTMRARSSGDIARTSSIRSPSRAWRASSGRSWETCSSAEGASRTRASCAGGRGVGPRVLERPGHTVRVRPLRARAVRGAGGARSGGGGARLP